MSSRTPPSCRPSSPDPALLTALWRLTDDDIARLHGHDSAGGAQEQAPEPNHTATPTAQGATSTAVKADRPPAPAGVAPSIPTDASVGLVDTDDDLTARLAAARAKKEKE